MCTMKLIENAARCPNCSGLISNKDKLKLRLAPSIRCPYCAKDLRISESKAFLVTLPGFAILAVVLSVYTDLSPGMALIALTLIVVLSWFPARTIEVLLTKLVLADDNQA